MTDLPYTYTDRDGDVLIVDARTIKAVNLHDTGAHEATIGAPTSSDAVAMARAVLAAAGDTGHRVVSQAEVEALQHRPEDRCYYCATDAEMTAAMESRPHPTIHMNLPEGACSQVRATDALDAQLPDCNGDVVNDIRVALSQRTDLTDEHRAFYSEIVNRFDGLAADRDGLRLTRDRYRDERNTARAELADAGDTGHVVIPRATYTLRVQQGFQEGARSMRERAANAAYDDLSTENTTMADTILALPLLPDEDPGEPQDEAPRDTELIQQVRALVKRYGAPWVAYEAARQARP